MKLVAAAAAALVTTLVATASAQPAMTPVTPVQTEPAPLVVEDAKSPETAMLLSLAGTIAPIALVAIGANSEGSQGEDLVTLGVLAAFVTPSLGHWYAGHYLTGGMAMRAGGAGLVTLGVISLVGECLDSEDSSCGDGGAGVMIAGAGLFAAGAIYDIATAGDAARAWNSSHLRIAPTMVSSGAHSGFGVGLGGSF